MTGAGVAHDWRWGGPVPLAQLRGCPMLLAGDIDPALSWSRSQLWPDRKFNSWR
jgi:hypothetical protein